MTVRYNRFFFLLTRDDDECSARAIYCLITPSRKIFGIWKNAFFNILFNFFFFLPKPPNPTIKYNDVRSVYAIVKINRRAML